MVFYRNLLAAAFELAPDLTMRAVRDVVDNFQMPGHGIENFEPASRRRSPSAGIYNLRIHHDDVVTAGAAQLKALEATGLGRRRRAGPRRAGRVPGRAGPAGDPVHREARQAAGGARQPRVMA